MQRLISFPTADGTEIVIEVDEPAAPGMVRAAKSSGPEPAAQTFEAAVDRIKPVAERVVNAVRHLGPDELQLEFGVKFNAKAGAIIASSAVEANFKVSVRWASE